MVELYRYYFFSSFLLVSEVLSPIKKKIIDLNNKYFFLPYLYGRLNHKMVTRRWPSPTTKSKVLTRARLTHEGRRPLWVRQARATHGTIVVACLHQWAAEMDPRIKGTPLTLNSPLNLLHRITPDLALAILTEFCVCLLYSNTFLTIIIKWRWTWYNVLRKILY